MNGMLKIHNTVVNNTPEVAKLVSALNFCEYNEVVDAEGIPETRIAITSNGKGTGNNANGSSNDGIRRSLAIAAFHKWRFFNNKGMSLYFVFAIRLPINIMESGMVISPTVSNAFDMVSGKLIGENKIINPIVVDRIPGFKKMPFQLIALLLLVNRCIPYDHISSK
ncbi:hypothetical protein GCM10027286_02870 [Virgibacillus ainsalahensis]